MNYMRDFTKIKELKNLCWEPTCQKDTREGRTERMQAAKLSPVEHGLPAWTHDLTLGCLFSLFSDAPSLRRQKQVELF